MGPDDEVCLCFHVTQRKIASFLRIERPQRVAQLSDCGAAGTGCGWCRPYLEKMFRQFYASSSQPRSQDESKPQDGATDDAWPSAEQYADMRSKYRKSNETRDA